VNVLIDSLIFNTLNSVLVIESTDKSKNTTQNKPTTAKKEEISNIIKPIIQSFHEQYKQNIEIQHENERAREIRQIYCQVSVLRRLQAMTLSQTNGILFAAALELPTCSRLQGLGQSLLLQECEKKTSYSRSNRNEMWIPAIYGLQK
jgi:hypothetical protein